MSYPQTVPTRRTGLRSTGGAALFMAALVALLWVLETYDAVSPVVLDNYGIMARDPDSLDNVLWAPFLHAGFGHLAANTLPFAVLGFLILLSGPGRWFAVTLASIAGSGLLAWLLSPPFTVTVGASGVIFGWLSYLLVRGFFSRSGRDIAIAFVVFLIFGGILWGVLPGTAGVSWQGHLGGAIGGLVAAGLLEKPVRRRARVSRYGV